MDTLGRHLLVELFDCDKSRIDDSEAVLDAARAAAASFGATIVAEAGHRYAPQGVTCVLLLAESHLAVHTWPEAGYVAADVYTCGALDPAPAAAVLARALGAADHASQLVMRGLSRPGRGSAAGPAARRAG